MMECSCCRELRELREVLRLMLEAEAEAHNGYDVLASASYDEARKALRTHYLGHGEVMPTD